MAEFCLKCFNEQWNKNFTEEEVKTAVCLCEGCAEYKPCVISLRNAPRIKLKHRLFLWLLSKKKD